MSLFSGFFIFLLLFIALILSIIDNPDKELKKKVQSKPKQDKKDIALVIRYFSWSDRWQK